MSSEECLPFRRIWVHPQVGLGFVLLDLEFSVLCFAYLCLSFFFVWTMLLSVIHLYTSFDYFSVFLKFLGPIQIPLQIKHIQVNHGLMIITNLSSKMVTMMVKYSGSVLHRKIEQLFKRQQQLCGHSMWWHCHHLRCNSYIDRMVSVS